MKKIIYFLTFFAFNSYSFSAEIERWNLSLFQKYQFYQILEWQYFKQKEIMKKIKNKEKYQVYQKISDWQKAQTRSYTNSFKMAALEKIDQLKRKDDFRDVEIEILGLYYIFLEYKNEQEKIAASILQSKYFINKIFDLKSFMNEVYIVILKQLLKQLNLEFTVNFYNENEFIDFLKKQNNDNLQKIKSVSEAFISHIEQNHIFFADEFFVEINKSIK